MITTERRIAVMDITTRWRIDGALFAAAGLGFLFAYGLVRFRGAARARRLERESRVRLSVGRSSWRSRKLAYLATPILF